MDWKKRGTLRVGEVTVEIRSLRVKDETGKVRRLRTCTVWKFPAPSFTRTPATGRLFKADDGTVGIVVMGRNMGYVKVGKQFLVQSSILVPFNCVSRKPLKRLMRGTGIRMQDEGGVITGWE